MNKDVELEAITTISSVLISLEKDVATRVLRWACDRFGMSSSNIVSSGMSIHDELASDGETPTLDNFDEVMELFDLTDPKTESDKAMVLAYWLQVCQGQADFKAYEINSQLKNMGHMVSNITVAMSSLIERKPRLAIQTAKTGKSKQARKKYKLTTEGVKKVQAMILEAREQRRDETT